MKKAIIYFVITILFFSISGCSEKADFSDGSLYTDKSLGIKVVPPKDWTINRTRKFLEVKTVFLEPYTKDAAISIDGTLFIKDLRYVQAAYPSKNNIKRVKRSFDRLPARSRKIVNEGKTVFNGKSAYFMDCYYYHKQNRERIEKKVYLMMRNNRLYKVSYEVKRNSYYRDNLSAVEKSLETLEFEERFAQEQLK